MRLALLALFSLTFFCSCNQDEIDKLRSDNSSLAKALQDEQKQVKDITLTVDSLQSLPIVEFGEILKRERDLELDTALTKDYEKLINDNPINPVTELAQERIYSINKEKGIQIAKEQYFGRWKLIRYVNSSWISTERIEPEDEHLIIRKDMTCELYKNDTLNTKEEICFKVTDCNWCDEKKFQVHLIMKESKLVAGVNFQKNRLSLTRIGCQDCGSKIFGFLR